MIRKLANFALAAVLAITALPLSAQQASQSQEAMPEVKQPDPEQGKSGLMSGEKPFTLMVDENVGELIYTFDEETKELESITAKRGVVFASDDMTLNSDDMEYTALNSRLLATGKKVVVRMGDMVITCQFFDYNPETQEGKFDGNPIVYQKDKQGKVTTTRGGTIAVNNVNGKFQMRVGAKSGVPTYVRSVPAAANQPLEKTKLGPGDKPATITLNNKPSGLAASPAAPGTANKENTSNSSVVPIPVVKSPSAAGDAEAPASAPETTPKGEGRIDPDNPADVKKVSE